MKLWFRLLGYLLTLWRRPQLESALDVSRLRFHVLPTDMDLALHMNNGRYLTIMDLGRIDLMVRTGLWRRVLAHKWTPVVSSALVRFRRELRLFEPFELETKIAWWGEDRVVFEQRLKFVKGHRSGEIAASALIRAGLYDRRQKSYVPIERLMKEMGAVHEPPACPPEITAFLKSEDKLRTADQQKAVTENEEVS